MRQFLNNRRGVTLVELMVGFAVFAVLLAASLSMMLFSGGILNEDADRDRLKMLGDEMYSAVSGKLTFATHLQLLPAGSSLDVAAYDNVLFVEDGRLYTGKKGGPYEPFYEDHVYQNTKLSLSAIVESGTILSLHLLFADESTTLYETGSSLRLINLASGTDAVLIEGSGSYTGPIISYDTAPYSIIEGGSDFPPEVSDTPYTVKEYTVGAEILPLTNGRLYQPGDIIVDKNGDYWQCTQRVVYYDKSPNTNPGHPHTYLWKSLAEDWSDVNKGSSVKSVYNYHDVVLYKGQYYMSILSNPQLNSWRPDTAVAWTKVYWFPERQTVANRMLGWSLTPQNGSDGYTSIYTRYP